MPSISSYEYITGEYTHVHVHGMTYLYWRNWGRSVYIACCFVIVGVLRLRVRFLLTGIGHDFKTVRTTEDLTHHGGLDIWKIGRVIEVILLGYSRYVWLHEIDN